MVWMCVYECMNRGKREHGVARSLPRLRTRQKKIAGSRTEAKKTTDSRHDAPPRVKKQNLHKTGGRGMPETGRAKNMPKHRKQNGERPAFVGGDKNAAGNNTPIEYKDTLICKKSQLLMKPHIFLSTNNGTTFIFVTQKKPSLLRGLKSFNFIQSADRW